MVLSRLVFETSWGPKPTQNAQEKDPKTAKKRLRKLTSEKDAENENRREAASQSAGLGHSWGPVRGELQLGAS